MGYGDEGHCVQLSIIFISPVVISGLMWAKVFSVRTDIQLVYVLWLAVQQVSEFPAISLCVATQSEFENK